MTSGMSNILLARGEARASFVELNSCTQKMEKERTMVCPNSEGRTEMLGVGRNFCTSGFGVSFIWTKRDRMKEERLGRDQKRLHYMKNNLDILRFRNSTLNKGKHRCEELSGILPNSGKTYLAYSNPILIVFS